MTVRGWLYEPAPAERLGLFRAMIGVFAVVYLVVRSPAFWGLTNRAVSRFEPVGVLAWMDRPLHSWLWIAFFVGAIAAGLAFAAGWAFRISGPLFGIGLLVVTTYRSSWGQLLYFEDLLVIQVLIVGFTRSADALSVRPARWRRDTDVRDASDYGWPLRLCALVMVATYVLAGVAKLRLGGLSWITGDTLRNHIAFSAARLGVLGGHYSPLAEIAVEKSWLLRPLAALVVLLELTAPVALLGGRVAGVWTALTWLMHVGIAATMFVVFPYPLSLIAFAPLFKIERLLPTRIRRLSRGRVP